MIVLNMVEEYMNLGAKDKGLELSGRFFNEIFQSASFYLSFYDFAAPDFETSIKYIYYLADIMKQNGFKEESEKYLNQVSELIKPFMGEEE